MKEWTDGMGREDGGPLAHRGDEKTGEERWREGGREGDVNDEMW